MTKYAIDQAHYRKTGRHINSPLRICWMRAGTIRAIDAGKALTEAERITGKTAKDIRISRAE